MLRLQSWTCLISRRGAHGGFAMSRALYIVINILQAAFAARTTLLAIFLFCTVMMHGT